MAIVADLKGRLRLVALGCVLSVSFLASSAWYFAEQNRLRMAQYADQDVAMHLKALATLAGGLQKGQALRNILLAPENQKAFDNFNKASKEMAVSAGELATLLRMDAGQVAIAEQMAAQMKIWLPHQQGVLDLVAAKDMAAAKTYLVQQETPAWRQLRETLLKVVETSEAAAIARRQALDEAQLRARNLTLGVGLSMIVFVILAMGYIGREVFRQVGAEPVQTAHFLTEITRGNLTQPLVLSGVAPGSILATAGLMQERLLGLIGGISGSAAVVTDVSHDLHAHAHVVLAASSEQSEATSAIAAAIEELTVSIGVMADNAQQAKDLSQQTEKHVQNGLNGMQATTGNIQRVAESMIESSAWMADLSAKVSSINGIANTIREIADQTNLLALNAAIEAARAGEQGRGFAVVADEVRKLAERTTASTSQITQMIDLVHASTQAAIGKMDQTKSLALDGAKMTAEVQNLVQGLDQSASNVRQAIDSISEALREQTAVSNEIAQKVEAIASGVEQSHAAANSTSKLAATLVKESGALGMQVASFKI